MSDNTFDLLEQLGDEKKVEQLKARIEKKQGQDVIQKLDEIEAAIEKAAGSKTAEEIIKNIVNSNFQTLTGDVEASEKDLQELMLHLRAMLDSCGGEFSKLQELNDEELKLVDNAKRRVEKAKKDLDKANGMSNAANIWFGMKNRRVKKATEELAASETGVKTAEEEANKRYRDRLKNADIKDSLNRIISQVQGMIGIIEGMVVDVDGQIVALTNRKEMAFETKEKAATVMKDRKADLEDTEAKLKQAEIELEEMANGSPEHTEQQKLVADLRSERTDLKGKYDIALGIFQSKERFVDQLVVHLQAQTTTKNNLKQLIGQLRSDTEERIATYESGLQLMQSATAQEAASIYEDAGSKTDQLITEIAAKVFVSSEQDRIERIKKHPKRMSELHNVLVAMAAATQKYKEQDAALMKEHAEKYGIDVSKEFSWKYASDGSGAGDEPVATDGDGGTGDVNDLLN
ncbi:MAG: hypothetical protein KTR13_09520 [Saprospiraceae bacterium]|nr:hypothetical protein [Saprospiraceae bacterium]